MYKEGQQVEYKPVGGMFVFQFVYGYECIVLMSLPNLM